MLKIDNLYFSHKGKEPFILKGITFEAIKGNVTTILGPNGSGKSTLLRCVAGLWEATKGAIYFDDILIDKLSYRDRAKILSFVPQEHNPPFAYTVLEVVLMGRVSRLGMLSSPGKKDYEIAKEALKAVGIEYLKDKPYTQISGGERQLTLIARALAQETPLILLDEPTSHLDFRNQVKILKKIRELASERNLTILMTLHDPNFASLFSDKIVILNSGIKLAEGPPKEILNEELIKRVYGLEVSKISFGNQNLIWPIL